MSNTNPKIDVSQFSNMPAVMAAAREAAKHLVPTAEEQAQYAEQDKRDALSNARLRNVAAALAHEAADALEPDAGQMIDDDTRERIARGIALALYENIGPLHNLVAKVAE
ncbi:hypothetical protein [Paraburkholderia susongensis]|uniref:Uncharacterized protein n=1 Tax=Paraburkholderia susongensis TaxID=1515439 RepID=A0A1X7JKG7_9BURK|nr:hypothetical protein [Paraburkholderia susongensis]SMG28342.1 hypothetical protein SAMN06265784_102751 [Paraburkholderia susongensis]